MSELSGVKRAPLLETDRDVVEAHNTNPGEIFPGDTM